jgi:hypothetical protein
MQAGSGKMRVGLAKCNIETLSSFHPPKDSEILSERQGDTLFKTAHNGLFFAVGFPSELGFVVQDHIQQ